MISALLITATVLILIGAHLVSLATDIQAKAAAIDAKATDILAVVNALKANQVDPADQAALQAATASLDNATTTLGGI